MAAGGRGGKKTAVPKQGLTLSAQTHLKILDYFQIASENSDDPAIRDAAISLAKDESKFLQKQTARLSPTLTLFACLFVLALAGVACWYFYVNYRDVAAALSSIVIGLALVGVCLLAMFAGQLSQANFVAVLKMVWSKISGVFSKDQGHAVPGAITAEQDSGESEGDRT